MRQKAFEAMGSNKASMEEGSGSWRRDGAWGEWQRWKGAWWVKVGRQNLNARQRKQISRGLRRLIAGGQDEMMRLMTELKNEIRAEVVTANASNARAQQCRFTVGKWGGGGAIDQVSWGRRELGSDRQS